MDVLIGASHDAMRGVWGKTLFQREGDFLTATVYLVIKGEPELFRMRVNVAQIEKAVARYHARRLHKPGGEPIVGFPPLDQLADVANKIGRSKLIQKIGSATKSVIRSKITAGVLTVASVVVPQVGAPAMAAYIAANKALDTAEAYEKGAKAIKGAAEKVGIIKSAKKASTVLKSQVKAALVVKAQLQKLGVSGSIYVTVRGKKMRLTPKLIAMLPAKTRAMVLAAAAKQKRATRSKLAKVPAHKVSSWTTTLRRGAEAKRKLIALLKLKAAAKNPKTLAQLKQLANLKALSRLTPAQRAKLVVIAKMAKANKEAQKLKAIARDPKKLAQLRALAKLSAKQKAALRHVQERAHHGTKAEQDKARRSLAILRIVAKNRSNLRAIASSSRGGMPGLVIDNSGRVVRGRFSRRLSKHGETSELIYTRGGQTQRGQFTRVSGNRYDCIQMPMRIAAEADIVGCGGLPCDGGC